MQVRKSRAVSVLELRPRGYSDGICGASSHGAEAELGVRQACDGLGNNFIAKRDRSVFYFRIKGCPLFKAKIIRVRPIF